MRGSPEQRRAETTRQVEQILSRVDRLPTLSPVAARLLRMGEGDEAGLNEVVPLVESDAPLSAAVLGLCRRSDKGLGEKITTVRRAVVMLGFSALRSLVLSVSVYETLGGREHAQSRFDDDGEIGGLNTGGGADGRGIDRRGLWKHLVATASGAELIAKEHKGLGVRSDEAFTAGLLHGLGRLALELALPRAYGRVAQVAEERRSASAVVERQTLGVDHHTAGRRLAERWGLPHGVVETIWLHGQGVGGLPKTVNARLIGVVTLARAWAREHHLGWSGDFDETGGLSELARGLGVEESALDGMSAALVEECAARCGLLGLDEQTDSELLLESVSRANRRLGRLNAALSARAQVADRRGAVLEEIAAFHQAASEAPGVVELLGAIVRSAGRAMGPGRSWMLVHEPGEMFGGVGPEGGSDAGMEDTGTWVVHAFAEDGTLTGTQEVTAPAGARAISGAAGVGRGQGVGGVVEVSVGVLGAAAWVGAALGSVGRADVGELRVLPLVGGDAQTPSAALIHDRGGREGGTADLGALVSAWGASVHAAWRRESAMRLGEQLAGATRELHAAQAALTERASLARLGELSAGAAHEMNNPLTVIRGRSQLLAQRLEVEKDRAVAASIVAAADRLSELITSMHLISTPPEPRCESIDPRLIVRLAIEMARDRLGREGESVVFRLEVDEGIGRVWTDLELTARALAEVLVNAAEASGEKPVRVSVQPDALEDRLQIRVSDQGPGLSERGLKHAFDPFFSEKSAGRQPGLGLARARSLIQRCGGEITLTNRTGGAGVLYAGAAGGGTGAVATIRVPAERPEPRWRVPAA